MTLRTIAPIDQALRRRALIAQRRGKTFKPVVPRLMHPKGLERHYQVQLRRGFTKLFRLVDSWLFRSLPALVDQNARELAPQRFDTADDELRLILQGILVEFGRELTQTEIKSIANRLGISVSEFNRLQNAKVYKKLLNVDVYRDELWLKPAIDAFATENAALIKTLSQRHIDNVRQLVVDGFRRGTTAKELAAQIRAKVDGKTRANFSLIARDQVSKLNGQLTKLRQKDLGIQRYVWRTSLDERVRPTHRAKEGRVYDWDNPPDDTGHPGEDFQCRCYAEPVIGDLLDDGQSL